MPIGSRSGCLHKASTAVRKFTHDNSDIFNAAAAIFTAFLALATFCVSVQANNIVEKYGRLEAYSKPLSYAIEVEGGSAEQIASVDNVLCLSDTPIDVAPSHGGISDIYAVAYSGGIVSSVLLPDKGLIRTIQMKPTGGSMSIPFHYMVAICGGVGMAPSIL